MRAHLRIQLLANLPGHFSKTQRHVGINASEAERQHVVSYAIDDLYATSHSTAC